MSEMLSLAKRTFTPSQSIAQPGAIGLVKGYKNRSSYFEKLCVLDLICILSEYVACGQGSQENLSAILIGEVGKRETQLENPSRNSWPPNY